MKNNQLNTILRATVLTAIVSALAACASAPTNAPTQGAKADQSASDESSTASVDPFEKVNRATFDFNNDFDKAIFKPVAQVYADNTPSFVQTGIGNFFGNLNDVWTGVNSFLQGNFQDGFTDIVRVGVNSTFGLLGLLDIASEANIPKHKNDLGQTLGVWGVPNGPYLVIPFLGPSVTRDAVALPVDFYGDPWAYARPVSVRNTGDFIRLVDKRAGYLDSFNLMQDAALDEYSFVRDAYLQRIAGQIETRKNHKQLRDDEVETQKQNDEDAKANAAKSTDVPVATAPAP
jgi:phospholipid-binding lipoprotein MlaA